MNGIVNEHMNETKCSKGEPTNSIKYVKTTKATLPMLYLKV